MQQRKEKNDQIIRILFQTGRRDGDEYGIVSARTKIYLRWESFPGLLFYW